jgi:hypothetical protein
MTGRKTEAQVLIELIDKRIRTFLGIAGKNAATAPGGGGGSSEGRRAFEDVSFITRNEHRGGGLGDLPNSRPVFDLDAEIVPDRDGERRLGLCDRAWKILYAHRVDLKGDNVWLKLSVDYFRENIAFKSSSAKVLIYGYGNHRKKDSFGKVMYLNTTTLIIKRPLPYDATKSYTSIKTWRCHAWYSRVDIDNPTGLGSKRSCASEASPKHPGVEAELVDAGNSETIYCRFRNFFPYPVVVGVCVSY